ncbi:hypothetical protein AWH48_01810 [Domibacillus aminovorans]|uniref:DNA-binding protein n=1 Tax=Domibacillus aminovorans TaxID=29332 RepID=A0A177KWM3_9BACI|nr:hypothetical protein AWH48_01810 [Domibacillus aminovorans]
MRNVHRIKQLISYLDSVDYPLTEEEIYDLILKREIPHKNPNNSLIVFDLDHIDWWINENRTKNRSLKSYY